MQGASDYTSGDTSGDIRFWRDSDLGGLELRFSRYDQACFEDHVHDTYSVGIIQGGTTRAMLRGKPASPRPGQVVLIEPEEVHTCNPVEGSGWAYRMFYADKQWFRTIAGDLAGEDQGLPAFTAPVVDDPELFTALRELARTIEEEGDLLEKQSAAIHAFSLVLQRHCAVVPLAGVQERQAVRVAKALLEARLAENVSLDELAEHCGLSRYHLLREFKRATGFPPHAWRTQMRIQAARRMLSSGMSITDVALETGFADQSHFSTTFKKVIGATPRQYQRG